MFKEIPKKNLDFNLEIGSLNTCKNVKIKILSFQDSSKMSSSKMQLSHPELKKEAVTSNSGVLQVAKVDSIAPQKKQSQTSTVQNTKVLPAAQIKDVDTSSTRTFNEKLPFQSPRINAGNNFLLDIPQKNILPHFDVLLISKPQHKSSIAIRKDTVTNATVQNETRFQGNVKAEASLNWLPGILLLSLFTFSWVKMAYQKYIVQVITSLVNYQASIRLLREKNVLFRNMAFGLNFVFALNVGLFIYFFLQHRNSSQIYPNGFVSVAAYSFGIMAVYSFKALLCKLIGNVFMVKEQFSEYVHNIHLYNKNIGLFLFPIVIVFPYITNSTVKPIVIYLGLVIIICMTLLLIYRGFQIIIRNGVSTFYLILYLCAVEILPILVLIKYSNTLI